MSGSSTGVERNAGGGRCLLGWADLAWLPFRPKQQKSRTGRFKVQSLPDLPCQWPAFSLCPALPQTMVLKANANFIDILMHFYPPQSLS